MERTSTLAPGDRKVLERKIADARDAAEKGAEKALRFLAVHEKEPRPGMSDDDKRLRRALRAKARQLGTNPENIGGLQPLVEECAYGQWHKMLFAGFLAHKNLLMHPDYEDVSVSLEDCAELAIEEGDMDGWATAAKYTAAVFPNVFPNEDPIQRVSFFREDQQALTRFLEDIPDSAYKPDEGLGWAYQFWQAKAKKAVNDSGRKIGGADIPAVTQLFTEDYMVKFLLHNTLGAWWAARRPGSELVRAFHYLRWNDDGTPAAGTFDGWPDTAAEVTVFDPCAGSGHFLTAAAELLAQMRQEEEGLSEADAAEAVLRDNLFGLELDRRCVQIAAFALALWAWKSGGYRPLPTPSVAWSGTPAGGGVNEWTALAHGDYRLEESLRRLHGLFHDAPELGSLIDPSRVAEGRAFARTGTVEMDVAGIEEVESLLDRALEREKDADDPVSAVFGEAARSLAQSASLLRRRYTLVATNVPYLARGKQADTLKDHLERYHPAGKADLATAFVQRCADYTAPGGSYALVTPQNWLFLGTYKKLRERFLKTQSWNLVARLGAHAFETISGEVVNVTLLALTNAPPAPDHPMTGLDVSRCKTPADKNHALREGEAVTLSQAVQLENPDARVSLDGGSTIRLLQDYATGLQGIATADYARFGRYFWELSRVDEDYEFHQSTVVNTQAFAGRENILLWQRGEGALSRSSQARIQGLAGIGKTGVAVSQMNLLPCTIYGGTFFDNNTAAIVPKNSEHALAIWTFCSSSEFGPEIRKTDQSLKVTNASLVKVPFDLERWQRVAEEKYPKGLPEPYSDDPTQWLFHGHPAQSSSGTALQVAVARLLGYRWPAEDEGAAEEMGLSAEAHAWILRCPDLDPFIDEDGIVCLPPVAGERPAAERLRALLAQAHGLEWSQPLLDGLLVAAGSPGKDLHAWLRDDFFKQHVKLFHNRPFVWHVWDGRKDGFSALVNYHTLDGTKLRRLIYTYLGSYIEAQTAAARSNKTGADLRLAAAQNLKTKLEAILHGEKDHDIYVRWKGLHEQPLGWEPDLNDGVRLNVRPFVTAGVLRSKFTVNWNKDRGKNPDGSERHNDLHLARAEKEEARRKAQQGAQ